MGWVVPARSTATAVLILMTLGTACVASIGEAQTRPGRPDGSRVDSAVEASSKIRLGEAVLPAYLGGYRAVSAGETGAIHARVRAELRNHFCVARGQVSGQPLAFGEVTTASGSYVASGPPVLWVAVMSSGWGEGVSRTKGGGIPEGGCIDVEYVIHAGALRITASRLWIEGMGDARILRTSVSGDIALVIACTPLVRDSCSAAMAELVHFLGV